MRILIFVLIGIIVLRSHLKADAYFVKLSPKGMAQRSQLLSAANTGGLKKQAASLFKPIVKISVVPSVLKPWLQIDIRTKQDKSYLNSLQSQKLIEKIEPVGFFKVQSFTNDSLIGRQWYLPKIGIPQAWQMSEGNSSIIVAIIDTGVDYKHPDLAPNIWHNMAELNGKPGVDDDGNGYVDDVVGWDFTDAPRFADGGDYLNPDPDPMDEFPGGHGTEIAGIIAAVKNNHIGISGIAPKVKIMVLRAGTAAGYLEEDDVIRALIYALNNGAKIINMSFGDTQVSSLFHDVLHYLWSKGIVLISAAGNSGSTEVFYPAGFTETIAVGASTQNDWLASFSNYGTVLDVLAPGVDMLSAAPNASYATVNGTSFSAPVVSAMAGLILSLHANYNNEQIRTILKGSATDLGPPGADLQTGAGRVDAFKALQIKKSGRLKIDFPQPNTYITGNWLPIVVTAYHPNLKSVRLYYGLGQNPTQWKVISQTSFHFFLSDTIARLSLQNLPDTTLVLRLKMNLLNDQQIEQLCLVRIDRTPPVTQSLLLIPAYEGTEPILLCSVQTDDPTALTALFVKDGDRGVLNRIDQLEFSQKHFFKISKEISMGASHLILRMHNSAKLWAPDTTIQLKFPMDFHLNPWQKMGKVLPKGFLLPKTTDINNNGHKEIVLSQYSASGGVGPIHIYEFSNGRFTSCFKTERPFIPRDVGDVNNNGKKELLLGFGSYSCLLQANDAHSFPNKILWQDSSFWAAKLTDLDQDGKGEIVGYRDSLYQILEWDGASHFNLIATLQNPTPGENRLGVPLVQVADLNNDGHLELIFGDYDGDVIVYTCTGNNQFKLLAWGKASQTDATNLLQAAQNSVFTLSHTAEDENLESQWERRYWSLDAFSLNPQNLLFKRTFISGFYPFYPKKNFESGIKIWQRSGQSFLFLSLYPYLYLFQKSAENWLPVWSESHCNSNAVVVDDLDGDGKPECYFNNGNGIVGFSQELINRPNSPSNCKVNALDSAQISIRWDGNGADGFLLYRGESSSELSVLSSTAKNEFTDHVAQMGRYYYYQVTALDSSAAFTESAPSNIDSAKTGYPPRLVKAWQEDAAQIILEFNQPMKINPDLHPKAFLTRASMASRNLTVLQPKNKMLAVFAGSISPETSDTVTVSNVFNEDGIPVDLRFNRAAFTCVKGQKAPYLEEIRIKDRQHVTLTFSAPMDFESVRDLSHYRLTPAGRVKKVTILNNDGSHITLQLSSQSMAGGFGQDAYLIFDGLRGRNGVEIGPPLEVSLIRQVENLDLVTIYPQPVRPENKQLIFAKLPRNSQIQIFTINGKKVNSFKKINDAGGVIWNLRDASGNRVHSGIYFYRIVHQGKEKIGKLVIVR